MRLPALRLAFLRGLAGSMAGVLRDRLLGTVLVLPADLPEAEREEICDLIARALDRPVHVAARAGDLPAGHVSVLTEPIETAPAPVVDEILIALRVPEVGRRRLGIPNELRLLRDAVLQAVAAEQPGGRLQDIAAWAQEVADSPSTALRFASAARGRALAQPSASDAELITEGLAETIAWLLHGVDPRVAEWALARAVPSANPGRLVSTEAALLGEKAALRRAFEAGLVDHLPERPDDLDDALDLRRPLALLGLLGDLSATVTLPEVAGALRPRLDPRVYRLFDRLLGEQPRSLGLDAPLVPREVVGRDEVITRLAALFEPAHEIRTVVVHGHGAEGIGKTTVAATLCARLSDRLEPVWLTFTGGPEAAWQRVADALGVDTQHPQRTAAGIPVWLAVVHRAMAERDVLIVVDDADAVPETELPAWLPAGTGACAVLVVSRRTQPVLQRDHDAIPVYVGPLTSEDSRRLLASLVPAKAEAVRRGEADGLLPQFGGRPLTVRLLAGLLEEESIDHLIAATKRLRGRDQIDALTRPALDALDAEARAVVDALAVATPMGSPRVLAAMMLRGTVADLGPVLTRLAGRALIELAPWTAVLKEATRAAAEREMGEDRRKTLETEHARAAWAVMKAAMETGDVAEQDSAYLDTLLGLERMTARCRQGDEPSAALVECLAQVLLDYPRGNHAERVTRVIDGYEAALTVHTKEAAPDAWAADQRDLGIALYRLPVGDREVNLRRAVAAHRAALTIWTPQTNPHAWAGQQNNLGVALLALPEVMVDNVVDAIQASRAALTIWTKDANPAEWAMAQVNLGLSVTLLPTGDRAENLRQAIASYHQALTIYTKAAFPVQWASLQNNLGNALAALASADGSDNVRNAIDAYRAALTVHTREAFPEDWARIQRNLGLGMARLPAGDRLQNLIDAIDAFRAALAVQTEETLPRERAMTQYCLAAAHQELASLDAGSPRPSHS